MSVLGRIFGRKSNPADELDRAVADAEARHTTARANLEQMTVRRRERHAALERATAAERAAHARVDEALLDGNAVAHEGAVTTLRRVERELAAARTAAKDADEHVAAATRATAEAAEELAAAKRAVRLAELRERASAATLRARIAEPAKRILAARRELEEAAAELEAALEASHAAGAEIRALGEAHVDVHSSVLLVPFAEAALAEEPGRAPELLQLLTPSAFERTHLYHAFAWTDAIRERLVRARLIPATDPIGRIFATKPTQATPSAVAIAREDLEALFSGGLNALHAHQREREEERQRAARAAYVVPPDMRRQSDEWIDPPVYARDPR